MPGTGYNVQELREGPEKVENLGDEKEQEGLAKVAENTDAGKGHAGKVTVRVTDKDRSGIPIVSQETECDTDKG